MCYRDHHGRNRMVVRFTTTYAISVYHLSSLLKVALNTINLNHSNMCYMMDATSEAEISRPNKHSGLVEKNSLCYKRYFIVCLCLQDYH
jgi:hypothetical protein